MCLDSLRQDFFFGSAFLHKFEHKTFDTWRRVPFVFLMKQANVRFDKPCGPHSVPAQFETRSHVKMTLRFSTVLFRFRSWDRFAKQSFFLCVSRAKTETSSRVSEFNGFWVHKCIWFGWGFWENVLLWCHSPYGNLSCRTSTKHKSRGAKKHTTNAVISNYNWSDGGGKAPWKLDQIYSI